MQEVYDAVLPTQFRRLAANFQFTVSIGIASVSNVLTCAGYGGYLARLIFYAVLPIVLAAIVVLFVLARLLVRRELSRRALVENSLHVLLFLLFLVYPIVTNVAFDAFARYRAPAPALATPFELAPKS